MKNQDFYYSNNLELNSHLYHEGKSYDSYTFLGCHRVTDEEGKEAYSFCVWAPRAKYVNLVGDFNDWNEFDLPMERISGSGIWNICVYKAKEFDSYKYRIVTSHDEIRYKADPYAFHSETRPKSASKVYDIEGYKWNDKRWLNSKKKKDKYNSPMSIYEVNLSSWKKRENNSDYTYSDLEDELVDYVKMMGYTHIELMPITEYPYDGSWGYQVTGYFSPTSRFGTPKDLMYFIDKCHQKNIGVIMDWVPVHFCKDDHGLARFDGTYCYESANLYKAENEQWGTLNFDYSKPEVCNFLISSALYWLKYFHLDGLRVDAVAYMLYLDFAGKEIRNDDGSNENIEAISFLKQLNVVIHREVSDTMMIAEESTAWPLITSPTDVGGLGFDFKWNMGWMNDILEYMKMDPLFRKDHHDKLTFTMTYAFSENYVLPFSHDEVVHMKGSMIGKMFGNYEDKFKQLRTLYAYMYAHPGKKLMFMGDEFAQFDEWNEWISLTWNVLEYDQHRYMQKYVQELNAIYKKQKPFYELDTTFDGYEWIQVNNAKESIIAFERIDKSGDRIICVFNFTSVERNDYPIGVLEKGTYSVLLNTDHAKFGGDLPRNQPYYASEEAIDGRKYSIRVKLPSFGSLYIKLKK